MTSNTAATATAPVTAADLATLPAADFYRHMAAVNEQFAATTAAHRAATDHLIAMLTEQVARTIRAEHPTSALLTVRTGAEFHHSPDGERAPGCEGHHERLIPYEILNVDGDALVTGIDPLSPLHYLMERLSPHLGLIDLILDLDTRDWAADITY